MSVEPKSSKPHRVCPSRLDRPERAEEIARLLGAISLAGGLARLTFAPACLCCWDFYAIGPVAIVDALTDATSNAERLGFLAWRVQAIGHHHLRPLRDRVLVLDGDGGELRVTRAPTEAEFLAATTRLVRERFEDMPEFARAIERALTQDFARRVA